MSLEHRFVFAEDLLLRCKCVKNEYVPLEMVDFDDILDRLNKYVYETKELQRRSSDEEKRSFSLIERFHLFENKRHSAPPACEAKKLRKPSIDNVKTDSVVLPMSPSMRNNRKCKQVTSCNNRNSTRKIQSQIPTNFISSSGPVKLDLRGKVEKENRKRNILNCLEESPPDFVHVIAFHEVFSAAEFLEDLNSTHFTVAMEIDVSNQGCISISYQKLNDFKLDFMMVDLSKKSNCMLFLKPF